MPAASTVASPKEIAVARPHGNVRCSTMYCIISAATTGNAATMECMVINNFGRSSSSTWRRTYSASSSVAAGNAGRMYPGSFDAENEKNAIGTTSQITRNTGNASPDRTISLLSFHHAQTLSTTAAVTNTIHGTSPSSATGKKYQNGSVW